MHMPVSNTLRLQDLPVDRMQGARGGVEWHSLLMKD